MARPTWTDIPSTDLDQDSPVDEDLIEDLEDNIDAARVVHLGKDIAEQTTTSTSAVPMATVYIYIPEVEDYTGIQRTLTCNVRVKVDAGTGQYALRDVDSPTTGSTVDSTSSTYETIAIDLDLESGWVDTTREIQFLGKQLSSGALYFKSIGTTWLMEF